MREIEPKFELFDIAHVGAGNWIVGDEGRSEIARLGETLGTAREHKNSGNKAKKWLKTKDVSFLKAANQESLTRQSAQIRPGREQGQFGKTRSGSGVARRRRGSDKKSATRDFGFERVAPQPKHRDFGMAVRTPAMPSPRSIAFPPSVRSRGPGQSSGAVLGSALWQTRGA
jgi:hypothetical protein